MNKNIQKVLGVTSIILALSPFTEELKTIVICNLGGKELSVFNVYFIYAGFFILFALVQFYFEAFYANNSNSEKRNKYSKISDFIYHIILTIPLATIVNIILLGIFQYFFPETKTDNNGFVFHAVVFLAQMILVMKQDYLLKFGKHRQSKISQENLLVMKELSKYQLDNKDYEKVAITHYEISKTLLGEYNNKNLNQIKQSSITDLITDAFKEKKISEKQKESFHSIASVWDKARLSSELNEETNNIFLNERFISRELDFFNHKKGL